MNLYHLFNDAWVARLLCRFMAQTDKVAFMVFCKETMARDRPEGWDHAKALQIIDSDFERWRRINN